MDRVLEALIGPRSTTLFSHLSGAASFSVFSPIIVCPCAAFIHVHVVVYMQYLFPNQERRKLRLFEWIISQANHDYFSVDAGFTSFSEQLFGN